MRVKFKVLTVLPLPNRNEEFNYPELCKYWSYQVISSSSKTFLNPKDVSATRSHKMQLFREKLGSNLFPSNSYMLLHNFTSI